MNLQQNGNATPSIAASLIERLPNKDDPQRPVEEKVAQDAAAQAFVGRWWQTDSKGMSTDSCIVL